ncbi:MAG: hypothetical protein ACLGI5_16650 [Thermoleophilia bacterium]
MSTAADPTPDAAVADPDAAEPAAAPTPPDGAKDDASGNAEAAKWRRQLRAEEAKTATLSARLDARDREHVERLAAERFTDPSDVWHATSLDAMRAEDGTIDLQRAEAELARVRKEHPNWVVPPPDVHQGAREPAAQPPSFGAMLKRGGRD